MSHMNLLINWNIYKTILLVSSQTNVFDSFIFLLNRFFLLFCHDISLMELRVDQMRGGEVTMDPTFLGFEWGLTWQ